MALKAPKRTCWEENKPSIEGADGEALQKDCPSSWMKLLPNHSHPDDLILAQKFPYPQETKQESNTIDILKKKKNQPYPLPASLTIFLAMSSHDPSRIPEINTVLRSIARADNARPHSNARRNALPGVTIQSDVRPF